MSGCGVWFLSGATGSLGKKSKTGISWIIGIVGFDFGFPGKMADLYLYSVFLWQAWGYS